jgi:ABC-type nitrate/sulfonate/bicarbonate transport system substrate-binding protein
MFKYSPSARAENADPDVAMLFGSMDAFEIWLPVLSAAVELNGKFFEIVTTLNNACSTP